MTNTEAAEQIELNNHLLLKVEDKNYHVWALRTQERDHSDGDGDYWTDYYRVRINTLSGEIPFEYQGSVMSQIKESQLPKEMLKLKRFFIDLHALDLLAPELLRQRTRDAGNSLGLGGEKLSSFLHEIGEAKRVDIQAKLAKIYPHFRHIDISSLASGWKKLIVQEQFGEMIVKTEARHVADGFLRMLAVFAQLSKEQSFLLLDEIENGVNPELIEFLVDELVGAVPQVLITTHSPMVLNYLVEYQAWTLFSKAELADRAKHMKARSRRGKKQPSETRYFYNNARALALLTEELKAEDRVVVLFRDGDGTVTSSRQEWTQKLQSMLDGFAVEGLTTGVPILLKPKSEAWWLCALQNDYQNCQQLEDESGNDASPNSLKSQIEAYLGEPATRLLLNDKIDSGEIDIDRIDMDSLNKFKKRLNEVLDLLGGARSKL